MCNPKSSTSKILKAFNLTLLAKQGLHILNETSSLLHKLYKAKYLSKISFLQSAIGRRNTFYAWCGIMIAKPWLGVDGALGMEKMSLFGLTNGYLVSL